ncbi:macrolide transport system ATP-binding/permease protein [Mumia flava]|uniref:Macrolide transport system ATP-binding/permease protein n=1 Tax=Mumia flava TaxID=1348852 RepID=A0A2M9BIW5_9ACTN|nr:macrolide transport system ATP-binding/permease protein [Mumia flava]
MRVVLSDVDVTASPGDRLGVVGENGAGKSTLLRVLGGRQAPDSGTVRRPARVTLLGQVPDLPDGGTVRDAVDGALASYRGLESRMRELEDAMSAGDAEALEEYGDVLEEYERRDGWSADARAERSVAGLGLGAVAVDRDLSTLSGGQRARLALALALVSADDLLLLDEPTNHLDDDALDYLESALREHPGVVVVVSHDRAFLDAVCTSVLDLDPSLQVEPDGTTRVGPERSSGAYTDYLAAKAAGRVRWAQARDAWETAHDEARAALSGASRQVGHGPRAPRDNDKFVPHFLGQKVDAAVARRVRDAENRLARLEANPVPRPPEERAFAGLGAARPADGVLVAARDIEIPGRLQLDALDVTATTRLLVTGPNGAGKSTLLAVLAGELTTAHGTVQHRGRLRIGYLPQHDAAGDLGATAATAYGVGRGGDPQRARDELRTTGLLHPRDLDRPMGELSVGQRRRVALARAIADRPDLLLLDEPTNHLSVALVEELQEALAGGTVPYVLVTHDRWWRRGWDGAELRLAGDVRGQR